MQISIQWTKVLCIVCKYQMWNSPLSKVKLQWLIQSIHTQLVLSQVVYLNYRNEHIWPPIRESLKLFVMPQFDWLCDVCRCVMSPTLDIYWVELGFINNCKEPQLWLVLLRYSTDVASAFPWVVTYGIRAGSVISCGLRDITPQSGP